MLMLVLAYCSSGHAKLRSLHGSPAEGLNWDGGSTQQGHWKPIEQVEDEVRDRMQLGQEYHVVLPQQVAHILPCALDTGTVGSQ